MSENADIVIVGTGSFAARIVFDLAATADAPTRMVIAGRRAPRLAWLETAACARAHMFQRPIVIETRVVDPGATEQVAELLARLRPSVVLQAASLQTGSVIAAQGNAWSRLVVAGGLSATAVFQAVLSTRVARACREAVPGAHFVNACFPDVVNGLIAALGLPVTCGIGNIQILAHAFAGALTGARACELKLLAHYQNLAAWRRAPDERDGHNARVWLDGVEVDDVFARFRGVQLTAEPVIDISGAAGVPLLLALAHGRHWDGHTPGPDGLPGGYPVRLRAGKLKLDLPPGLTREVAVDWNLAHEDSSGLVIDGQGYAHYEGRLRDELSVLSPDLAEGFHVSDLETAFAATQQLRDELLKQPA